jgi:hypothetical protein
MAMAATGLLHILIVKPNILALLALQGQLTLLQTTVLTLQSLIHAKQLIRSAEMGWWRAASNASCQVQLIIIIALKPLILALLKN